MLYQVQYHMYAIVHVIHINEIAVRVFYEFNHFHV